MTCPYCGGEMRHGEITTVDNGMRNILQWMEGEPLSKGKKLLGSCRSGKMLQMPYVGFRYWIPADFCPKCKKMIFETDILEI